MTDHRPLNKETSIHGVREDQKESPIDAVAVGVSDEIEDGEVNDALPIRAKRSPSASIEEEPALKKLKPASEPMTHLFTEMRRPKRPASCIISVDRNEQIGGLYPVSQGFAINFHVNPGPEYAPSITLDFKTRGTWKGTDGARFEWDTEAVYKRRFAISHLDYGYASPDAPDPRRSDPKVLDLCNNKDMSQLLYIRFDSWDQAAGFSNRNAFNDQSPAIKKAIKTIRQPQKPYHMEIWFLAPFEVETFRRDCLSYLIDSMKARQNTLHNWQDRLGNRYVDRPLPPRSTAPPDMSMGKLMFRVHHVPQAQDAEIAQNVEDSADVLAQDASMAGRSTSPRLEEQMTLTSRAGPTSPSAEQQITSQSRSLSEFVMPRSKPLPSRFPMKGFLPETMMGSLDVSDGATYHDSNIEPGPDASSDEVEERQQEDEEEGNDPAP